MTEEQRNYGVEPEPGGPGSSEPDGSRLRSTHTNSTISASDERTTSFRTRMVSISRSSTYDFKYA